MSVFLRIQVRTNSQTNAENGEQDQERMIYSLLARLRRGFYFPRLTRPTAV